MKVGATGESSYPRPGLPSKPKLAGSSTLPRIMQGKEEEDGPLAGVRKANQARNRSIKPSSYVPSIQDPGKGGLVDVRA